MSFGQEVKDFVSAFQTGANVVNQRKLIDAQTNFMVERAKAFKTQTEASTGADGGTAAFEAGKKAYGGRDGDAPNWNTGAGDQTGSTGDSSTGGAPDTGAKNSYAGPGGFQVGRYKGDANTMDGMRRGAIEVGKQLGINPQDILTTISYETGGTFNPWQRGPTTKWGQHRGLIQWGEPQRQKYGVSQSSSSYDQMMAVGRYLKDAGVKPGMGLLDVYSAVNAGRVGKYGASDAHAGGAPGNVRQKVATMSGHAKNAARILAWNGLPGATVAAAIPSAMPDASEDTGAGGVDTGAGPTATDAPLIGGQRRQAIAMSDMTDDEIGDDF